MPASYRPEIVKKLAANPDTFEMFKAALDDALGCGLDADDVRDVFQRIDKWNFIKSEPTRKYYPETMSDYYIYDVEECSARMFIKFLISRDILVVTSFKEDTSRDV